jgi:hypothetical protein
MTADGAINSRDDVLYSGNGFGAEIFLHGVDLSKKSILGADGQYEWDTMEE